MRKGFTLIELLLVISLIGLLASIILTTLQTAKNRANDIKIRSNLAQIQRVAEVYLTSYGNYGIQVPRDSVESSTYCPGNISVVGGDIGNMFYDEESGMAIFTGEDSLNNYPAFVEGQNRRCFSSGNAYAVLVTLSDGNYWCVDSKGNSKARNDALLDPENPTC